MEIADLKLATRGDVAAFGLGYAAGFAIDNYFFPGGLTSGVVAAVSATGAVGFKNFVHAIWNSIRAGARDEWTGDADALKIRAESVMRYIQKIVDRSENPKEHALRKPLEEYERIFTYWTNGLITDQEFYEKGFI